MAPRRRPVPILTEEQRAFIRGRRIWQGPGEYSKEENEFERNREYASAARAEEAGLQVNPRDLLMSTDHWLNRFHTSEVPQRAVAVEETQLTGGEPLEDGPTAAGTVLEGGGEVPVPTV